MTKLEKVKTEVLKDLRELCKLNGRKEASRWQVYTKPTIQQVENGDFDYDIIELYEGGLSITHITDFLLHYNH